MRRPKQISRAEIIGRVREFFASVLIQPLKRAHVCIVFRVGLKEFHSVREFFVIAEIVITVQDYGIFSPCCFKSALDDVRHSQCGNNTFFVFGTLHREGAYLAGVFLAVLLDEFGTVVVRAVITYDYLEITKTLR